MSRYYLGLDSSTQSLTAVLIDLETGKIVCERSVSFEDFKHLYGTEKGVVSAPETPPRQGARVWSFPLMWLEALDQLLKQLRAALAESKIAMSAIAAIAGSGQQHGTVYLNDQAETLLAKLAAAPTLKDGLSRALARERSPIWMDSSTGLEVAEIEAAVGGRSALLEQTGNVGFERFSGPQIRRIFKEEPAVYRRTAHLCLVSSFMASVLAGRVVPIDHGDGAGMNLMDIRTRHWHPQALAATAQDLDSKLLAPQPTDTVAGSINGYFVDRHGFSPDCQVALWSGDNPCSLIGLGLIKPGVAAISLGTSHTVFGVLGQPRFSETGEGCVFVSPAGVNMALLCFANGSLGWEKIRDQFGLNWNSFSSLLRGSRAGNYALDRQGKRGPYRFLLPYFVPEIAPKVPQPLLIYQRVFPHDAEACVRGAVEARALAARLHCEWMGEKFQTVRLTGGAARDKEIVQVFANVFGATAECLKTTSSAALGGALMAAYAHQKQGGTRPDWSRLVAPFTQPVMTIEPDADATQVYDDMLAEFRSLEQRHAG
jgi:xylulokinase